jgi:hypothetical protein
MSQRTLDTERIVRLLEADAVTTLGPKARREVRAVAAGVAENALDQMEPVEASGRWPASPGASLAEAQAFFDSVVVDRFQQDVHDEHWDTTWPACPRHPNHPLWCRDGAWWCVADNVAIAPLGGLGALRPPAT